MSKFFDASKMDLRDTYKLMTGIIAPRPIGWISTLSKEGVANLAPYSFFNMVSNNPPVLAYSPALSRDRKKKDSLLNAQETGGFVHNVVTKDLVEPMVQSSFEYPRETSEFEKLGLTAVASEFVKAPRLKEAAINIECELMQVISFGDEPTNGQLVLGKVVGIHINREEVLAEDGLIDSSQLPMVSRLGRSEYLDFGEVFSVPRPKEG